MGLWRIWHPTYGVIYDETGSDEEREVCVASNTSRPRTEGLDEPFGPPPEEYLYRCPVCGEEMLVNEAIIDVAIGMAKFRGEYTRGCP